MNILGNNNWVIIPNENGEFGIPVLLEKGCTVITNYDEIKTLKSLNSDIITKLTEVEIYVELFNLTNREKFSLELVESLV